MVKSIWIGQRIRAWRLRRGLSEVGLGRASGIPDADIRDLEDGLQPIGRLRLKAISAALDVPMSALIGQAEASPDLGPDWPTTEQVRDLVAAFIALPKPLRAEVADLVSALGRHAATR